MARAGLRPPRRTAPSPGARRRRRSSMRARSTAPQNTIWRLGTRSPEPGWLESRLVSQRGPYPPLARGRQWLPYSRYEPVDDQVAKHEENHCHHDEKRCDLNGSATREPTHDYHCATTSRLLPRCTEIPSPAPPHRPSPPPPRRSAGRHRYRRPPRLSRPQNLAGRTPRRPASGPEPAPHRLQDERALGHRPLPLACSAYLRCPFPSRRRTLLLEAGPYTYRGPLRARPPAPPGCDRRPRPLAPHEPRELRSGPAAASIAPPRAPRSARLAAKAVRLTPPPPAPRGARCVLRRRYPPPHRTLLPFGASRRWRPHARRPGERWRAPEGRRCQGRG